MKSRSDVQSSAQLQSATALNRPDRRRSGSEMIGGHKSLSSSKRKERQDLLLLFILAGPALFWYLAFMIGPLVSMFYFSTLDWGGLLAEKKFAGLANFQRMFTDPLFPVAVRNTLIHVGVTLPLQIALAFLLGYYLSLRPRGYRLLNIVCFTPSLLSASAKVMLFIGVYSPNGIINSTLHFIGLGSLARLWTADPATALATLIIVDLWGGIGFAAVVFSARLVSISPELYEAADIDGASQWMRISKIAFPMAREFVGVLTMISFLGLLLGSAATVLLLTQGGPGNASTTLSFMLYNQAFVSSHLGYSQAIGVVLFVVGLLGMLLIRQLFRPSY